LKAKDEGKNLALAERSGKLGKEKDKMR